MHTKFHLRVLYFWQRFMRNDMRILFGFLFFVLYFRWQHSAIAHAMEVRSIGINSFSLLFFSSFRPCRRRVLEMKSKERISNINTSSQERKIESTEFSCPNNNSKTKMKHELSRFILYRAFEPNRWEMIDEMKYNQNTHTQTNKQ